MDPQRILTNAITAIQADQSMTALSRVIHTEMLFAAKRHLRDARLAAIGGRKWKIAICGNGAK